MSAPSLALLAGPFPSTAVVYNHLQRKFPISGVIIERRQSRIELLRRRVRKFGAGVALGQFCFRALALPALAWGARRRAREIKDQFGFDEHAIPPEKIFRVPSANHPAAVEALRKLAPAAIVVNGTRLISADILAEIQAPLINLHAGITPRYRGTHGAYWALVENDRQHCGVSLHLVDRGIDTGAVLAQALIAPGGRDNFATYPLLQLAGALPLLDSVLAKILRGEMPRVATNGDSRLWSHPTLAQYLRNRARGVK